MRIVLDLHERLIFSEFALDLVWGFRKVRLYYDLVKFEDCIEKHH